MILYIFLLELEVSLDFILDVIYKWVKISKAFSQKNLEFFLGYRINFFLLNTKLVLLQVKMDFPIKKQDCKRYAFMPLGSSNFKIILIEIYVQNPIL